jgi:hypothetical protein
MYQLINLGDLVSQLALLCKNKLTVQGKALNNLTLLRKSLDYSRASCYQTVSL